MLTIYDLLICAFLSHMLWTVNVVEVLLEG